MENLRIWRWDQGRLSYFNYDNLKRISRVLVSLEGVEINMRDFDPLRLPLESETGLPFAPDRYKVWRNYKRVFECSLLATGVDNRLFVSDICRTIAAGSEIDVDEYLSLVLPRFRFPFPAFQDYNPSDIQIYPFCAILKYLISTFKATGQAALTLEETFSFIIGNNCTGREPLEHYLHLTPSNREPQGDERRQVREMLIFISQLSILKWYGGRLVLDVSGADLAEYEDFVHLLTPRELSNPSSIREEEFARITRLGDEIVYPFQLQSRESPIDVGFTEGQRVRVTHVKIERSPLLRRIYFEKYPQTICNMCECDTHDRYPWTENLLEIHHLLPLSSALVVSGSGTSLEDVVPLCPTCHRSVHVYYKQWLNAMNVSDFSNRSEAVEAYSEAKRQLVA